MGGVLESDTIQENSLKRKGCPCGVRCFCSWKVEYLAFRQPGRNITACVVEEGGDIITIGKREERGQRERLRTRDIM